jgi:hypothetical protein
MDSYSLWRYIFVKSRKPKQLPLDIRHCSPMALRNIILDAHTPTPVLESIALVYSDDEYILRDLVRCPNLSETTLAFIALTASEEIQGFIAQARAMQVVTAETADQAKQAGGRTLNVIALVQKMSNPQKIKLALTGGKEARGLLIRESNKQIATAVLENPRVTDGEIDFFAKATNLSEDIMRKIGSNSDWTKRYSVAHALVNNPKCPPGIAMGFVVRMNDKDLSLLEKSRNVSEAVRSAARSLVARKNAGKKH